MQQTLFKVFRWPSWQLLRYTDPYGCGLWLKHVKLTWKVFCDGDYDDREKCKRRFLEHYEHMRRIVPPDRLLEYQIQECWDPLVKFLGLEERSGAIPSGYGQVEFLETHTIGWKSAVVRSAKNLLKILVESCGVIGTILYVKA